MSRIPVRVRLTLAFALVMAAVLAATGLFLYLRLGSALDETLDNGLRSRADDVTALVLQAGSGLSEGGGNRLAEQGESFAQVLDRRGRVIDTTPQLGRQPLLGAAEVKRAATETFFIERRPVAGDDEGARLLATPVIPSEEGLVVVVGTSLEDRDDALSGLLAQLLIGGPLALLVASGAGYALAAAALRPVESMRRRAEEISAAEPGRRLPVPEAEDEVRRLGETLNDMLSRLELALARERRFVTDASHELRTPLALLKAELELALRQTRSAGELEAAIRSAAAETDRLAQLAEDLLVLARADQGRLPVRRERVAAGTVLSRAAERFRARAEHAGRAITTDAPAGLELAGDELRLEQALGNLIENALRHGLGAIVVSGAAVEGAVELHVLDEGPGFPPEFLATAFDRFTRSDEARASGGAGLGLAIVDVIARAHGGQAGAANRPGGGADVWLSIPTS
jgi:signal transduction histidine kinase